MPVSPQANQMSMLQQAMQAMQAQQQLGPMIQKLMAAKQQPIPMQNPSPTGQGLGTLMGGGSPQQPPTLGVNQPIPMQMPPAISQGQQQQPPIDPEAALGGGGAGPQ